MVNQRKSEKPKDEVKIAVGDLETDPFAPGRIEINPFVAGFWDGKNMEIFWGHDCCKKFVQHVKKLKGKWVIYFHNGGNFDFHFLLEFLPVEDCEFMLIGKRIVQIKLPWGVELRDSFAIIPKKLAAYEKEETDYSHFEKPVREKYKNDIISYLKSDLRNLMDMVLGFFKRFPNKLTLASSVFELMKTDFDYDPGRSEASYDNKFRPFFFGGRVEFFELGEIKGDYEIIDINSAYPWAMTKEHWYGFEFEVVNNMPRKNGEQGFYIVSANANGCFPLRVKNYGVSFPVGKERFLVSGWELKAAIELKLVSDLKILIGYVPTKTKSMKSFADTFYEKKLEAKKAGDKEEEFFNKIGLNAGYGRLALNPFKFQEVKVTTIYDRPKRKKDEQEWKNCWHDIDRGLSFWKRPKYRAGIDKPVNVATAASITGCVRAFLLRSMASCGRVVYCDTDSIIVSSQKRRRSGLKLGEGLGEWKKELSISGKSTGLWIAGKKLYAARGYDAKNKLIWKVASKGVKLKPEEIIKVSKGQMQKMTFDAPTFSLFSPPKFVTREVNRADKRK